MNQNELDQSLNLLDTLISAVENRVRIELARNPKMDPAFFARKLVKATETQAEARIALRDYLKSLETK